MADKLFFHTPVGRFVSGSLTELRTHDHLNRPIDPDKQTYQFGLAIRKDDPGVTGTINQMIQYAHTNYSHAPAVQQRIVAWTQTFDGFSMKITDGDAPNQKGAVNENTKGCYVFWYSTGINVLTANAQNMQIDPSTIKRGYYVDVASSIGINGLTDGNAGIYLNPTCVRLIAEGDEIVSGMSVDTALQNAPAAPTNLPPGARPLGSTPQPPASSGAPGTGLPGFSPATPAQALTLPGVGAGTAPQTPAASQGGIASPTEQHPPHKPILGLPGSM